MTTQFKFGTFGWRAVRCSRSPMCGARMHGIARHVMLQKLKGAKVIVFDD
jgi:hypothetical protein